MRNPPRITVIIPALNEEASIGHVLDAIPRELEADVIVADNGSTDRTAEVAREHGARVVAAPRRGYGSACLAGMAAVREPVDIVVFLDADFSDFPEKMPELVAPIVRDEADLVIGSRALGEREKGALTPQQLVGNIVASRCLRLLYGMRCTDLGPFRAIRWDALQALGMSDPDYGWTVQMQILAARRGLRYVEVPVPYRRRIGKSKIMGTFSGSVKVAFKIFGLIGLYALKRKRGTPVPPEG